MSPARRRAPQLPARLLTRAEHDAQVADAMTEAILLAHVKRLARELGWLVYHTRDSRGSDPGFPDLHLVRGTRILYRELKTAKGRIRPEQAVYIERLALAGADVAVWRPANLTDGTIAKELR